MWFGHILLISLAAVALIFIFSICGARVREHPAWLFTIGFFVAGAGAALWVSAELFSETAKFLCPRLDPSEDCLLTSKFGVMTGKLIEVGFAALGAGLMALAIDIRSKAALDSMHRKFESKAKKIQKKKFIWRRAFEKLGEELDDIAPQERVKRYKQLQDAWWDIQDDKDDLREEFGRWRLEYPDDDDDKQV